MDVSIETTSGLERRMTVRVPADRFETEVTSRLKQTARQVRLPGFRPRRVPMREVQRRFGPSVRQEVAGELMQSSFFEAVQSESLRPAGPPALQPGDLQSSEGFEFTATFEVFPEVEIGDLASIEVKRPVAELTEADVDDMIERLREQRRRFEAREGRAAEEGDQLRLDFRGFLADEEGAFADDAEPFEGGSAEGAEIVIGSGRMIPGFEDELKGLAAGDEKRFEVTFPDDYGAEHLKGRKARFEVTVSEVAESVKPEVDDAFIAEFGVEEGGMEAFRAEVLENMSRELRTATRTYLKNQVLDALARMHGDIILPQAMVREEVHRAQHEMAQQFGGGNQIDPHQLPAELFRDQAERRVRLGLVLNRLVEQESVEPDPERVEALLEDIAAPYGEPEQVKAWYHSQPEQMQQLRSAAVEDQVIDLVLERAKVEEETSTYDDVLAASRAQPAASDEGGAEAGDDAAGETDGENSGDAQVS
jgi:trigger factor